MEEGEKADGSHAEALAAPCLPLNHSLLQQKEEKKKHRKSEQKMFFYISSDGILLNFI